MKQFSTIRLLLASLLVAVVSTVSLSAQGNISIGGYVAERGGWNSSITAFTRGDFMFANLPDVGVEALYSITRSKDAAVVLNIGLLNFAARSISYDLFNGKPTNDFVMSANALYASAALGLRFYKFFGLPEFSLLLRTGVPLRATYTSTVDVFEINGTAQLPTGQLSQYTLPNDRMLNFTEFGADIGVATLPLGEGMLTLYVQGAMTMTQLVRLLPIRQIPDNYNIIGKDPLAGLRTMNMQPISVSIGLRYGLEVAALNVAPH
jgi:hypothetical protein